ncbi:Uncharacterised protein [Bordetella pertussis]|nr:Uncharacterised protein [Bordetella pertussis]
MGDTTRGLASQVQPGQRARAAGQVAAQRVDVVVGDQLAAAGGGKIGNVELVGQLVLGQREILVAAVGAPGKGRMGLEPDAGPQPDVVDAFGDLRARRIGRQLAALRIEVARRIDGGRGARHQLVRALQVMVAVQRFVDVVGVRRLVGRVGAGRIQVFGRTLDERGVERIVGHRAGGVRAVDGAFAGAARHRAQQQERRDTQQPGHACHVTILSRMLAQG